MRQWVRNAATKLVHKPVINLLGIIFLSSMSLVGVPSLWLTDILIAVAVLSQPASWAIASLFAALVPVWLALGLTDDHMRVLALLFSSVNHTLLYVGTALIAGLWRRFRAPAPALEVVALISVFCILVLHILFPEVAEWWWSHLAALLRASVEAGDTVPVDADFLRQAAQSMTGYVTMSSLLMSWLMLWMGARWLTMSNCFEEHQVWMRPVLLQFKMSWFYVATLIVGFAVSLFYAPMRDAMTVLWLVPTIAGLSILQHLIERTRYATWWWIGVIGALILFANIGFFLVACLGVVDRFIDMRSRFSSSQQSRG